MFSRLVETASVGPDGTTLTVTATDAERAAIAASLGLRDLSALSADLELTRTGRDRVEVAGHIHADLVQSCVVTLEPVAQTIDDGIDRHFVSERAAAARGGQRQVDIAVAEDDPPDIYDGRAIDVGEIVLEQFILGIDPYPRAPGAELPAEAGEDADRPESAFAILKTIGHSDGT